MNDDIPAMQTSRILDNGFPNIATKTVYRNDADQGESDTEDKDCPLTPAVNNFPD
jgi:hypothetical protein